MIPRLVPMLNQLFISEHRNCVAENGVRAPDEAGRMGYPIPTTIGNGRLGTQDFCWQPAASVTTLTSRKLPPIGNLLSRFCATDRACLPSER